MLNTLGIVEVRPDWDLLRLTACRRLGGKSLLEWVAGRMTESQLLTGVIVLAPKIVQADELGGLVPSNVPLVVSDKADAVARFADALDQFPSDSVVHVGVEHPFIDPVLIDRLVTTAANHSESDYIGYRSRSGRPAVKSPVGGIGEWIRSDALVRADCEACDPAQRDHVTGYLHAHPERFNLRLIPIPPELDRDDVRLTIRGEEDWEHAQAIFEALGPEQMDYQRIAHLLDHQPALRERMAMLNRLVGAV
jgi:spore coat polysaccharide biosynthesis protein SpsF